MKKLLLTGAGGNLGKVLRHSLASWAQEICLSDIHTISDLQDNESFIQCDLGDSAEVFRLVEGCDAIIHLGGISTEDSFENILNANIQGTYNIYEAARQHGIRRIIFASSNHLMGFHQRESHLNQRSEMRPDSVYGLSKGFGELVAQYYYDKYNIESVCIRIGSCYPKPLNRRMLATWLSERDLTNLVKQIYVADRVGCTMIYGVSNNSYRWWDNQHASFIGWHPQDNSAVFENEDYLNNELIDPNDPAVRYQGGDFVSAGHFEET
jgi:uronate dehydrogenase